MQKVALLSTLLILGLVIGQGEAALLGPLPHSIQLIVEILTLIGLSYIMIEVGLEFQIQKDRLKSYGWDYVVAMTAAAFPWIFVLAYFIFVLLPDFNPQSLKDWGDPLLVSRFAAPTSAGILFSMLAAAGLGATWVFKKARVLAIFDDLDTVLLMVPLTMLIVGFAWQLLIVVAIMALLLWLAWAKLHSIQIPSSWSWVTAYSVVLVILTEGFGYVGHLFESQVPLHIEVLLPAFVLGVIIKQKDSHAHLASDVKASSIVSMIFVFLVGFGMPPIFGETESAHATMTWGEIAFHVLMVTLISNLGKMFPVFCYRKEATFKERLALSIGMWPRGEVGAGILVIAIGYNIHGPMITVAMLSLVLNLVLTGGFIFAVQKLIPPTSKTTSQGVSHEG